MDSVLSAYWKLFYQKVRDLFVNIPIQETLNITDNVLQQKTIDSISKNQILQLMKTVLFQNYFTFSGNIYQPPKGIAVGSPISSIISEIFLKYYETNHQSQGFFFFFFFRSTVTANTLWVYLANLYTFVFEAVCFLASNVWGLQEIYSHVITPCCWTVVTCMQCVVEVKGVVKIVVQFK
jgi:hypothetical protein